MKNFLMKGLIVLISCVFATGAMAAHHSGNTQGKKATSSHHQKSKAKHHSKKSKAKKSSKMKK